MRVDHPLNGHTATISSSIPPALAIVAIACTVFLLLVVMVWVLVLRHRVQRLASQVASREAAMSNLAAELEAQALLARQMSMDLEELRKRLLDHEEIAQSDAPLWSATSMPVNLNRRGQILRLSRKGKSVSEIAQDLNVAQGEVELLLKVHDLTQKSPSQEK